MPAAIKTVNLTKRYGNLVALSNLNLEIDEGDCFGFIGPNGAGKSTTIKILATLLQPTWGEARICDQVVGYQSRQIRPLIGYVPDYFGAYEDMVVKEYLEFFAAAYNINGAARDKVVGDVLTLTDLSYKLDAPVDGLSRGMKQRLSIARVLLHDPKVLLLDEPAGNLDPRARIEMRELLKELRRMGKTILISSHILPELQDLCNKVGIIEQGELKYAGPWVDIVKKARTGTVGGGGVAAAVDGRNGRRTTGVFADNHEARRHRLQHHRRITRRRRLPTDPAPRGRSQSGNRLHATHQRHGAVVANRHADGMARTAVSNPSRAAPDP
jgi:ABC-2 type transport system ATP-binding protein